MDSRSAETGEEKMSRFFYGHDVPNWAFIAMTLLAALLAEGFTSLIDKYERIKNYDEPDRP